MVNENFNNIVSRLKEIFNTFTNENWNGLVSGEKFYLPKTLGHSGGIVTFIGIDNQEIKNDTCLWYHTKPFDELTCGDIVPIRLTPDLIAKIKELN